MPTEPVHEAWCCRSPESECAKAGGCSGSCNCGAGGVAVEASRPMRLRPGLTLGELKARAGLAEEIVQALNEAVCVASGSSYFDGVNDVLALLRGVDPQALLEANVAARKARLGW